MYTQHVPVQFTRFPTTVAQTIWCEPVVERPATVSVVFEPTGPLSAESDAVAFVAGSNPTLENVVCCVIVGVTFDGHWIYGLKAPGSFVIVKIPSPLFA